jgi:hypothetical protein
MTKTRKDPDWMFIAGIILLVCFSIISGLLNIGVLYLFGIPLLGIAIGLGLIWFSRITVRNKLFCTLLPLPLILVSFLSFLTFVLGPSEPETFLFPENFRGQFEVVFNEPCGQSVSPQEGGRIYHIPTSGVLIVREPRLLGRIDQNFLLADLDGKQRPLSEFHWSDFEKEANDWHWYWSREELSENTLGVLSSYRSTASSLGFFVTDYRSLRRYKEDQERFKDVVDAAIRNCRNGVS